MQKIESLEVEISTVHYIEGAGLRDELIKDVHVMDVSLGYGDKRWDVAAEVEQGMEFDGSFSFSKPCPGKQRKAQING